MSLFGEHEEFAWAVEKLTFGNPFRTSRLEAEKRALGTEFDPEKTLWHSPPEPEPATNVAKIAKKACYVRERVRERLHDNAVATVRELDLYRTLVLYSLYEDFQKDLYGLITDRRGAKGIFDNFCADLERYLSRPSERGSPAPPIDDVAHLFALCFQVRRAFHYIFANIRGRSTPSVELRAAVWCSIFTNDFQRYRNALFRTTRNWPTLVTGESGTGKELVASAIALSQYMAFDTRSSSFPSPSDGEFMALVLSALSPHLIESELFGHIKGAFTGAHTDHIGFFQRCQGHGAVFLDEIGDVDCAVQVKLLRVLETRKFRRVGETHELEFKGKIIAATNRNLTQLMAEGLFREDFYYRLCADRIVTPPLREQLRDAPAQLDALVDDYLARRELISEEYCDAFKSEAVNWIRERLGDDYSWPGNVRELGQCIRSLLIRGSYERREAPDTSLADDVAAGTLTLKELTERYCTHVLKLVRDHAPALSGNQRMTRAAEILDVDVRTLKTRVSAKNADAD